VLELAHNHESLLYIHNHWGPKTCSAPASNLWFGGRHIENAEQLSPLLVVESLACDQVVLKAPFDMAILLTEVDRLL